MRNKYNAQRTILDGLAFDSKREANRYAQLKLLQMAGEIESLEFHPTYPLVVHGVSVGSYEADFRYVDSSTGKSVVEDAKGVRTAVYRLKKKLLKALYGIDVHEV